VRGPCAVSSWLLALGRAQVGCSRAAGEKLRFTAAEPLNGHSRRRPGQVLRGVIFGICVLPAPLLAAAPALAEGPQRSATPSVDPEIGYAHEQVRAGGLDTMTVSLVNHGRRIWTTRPACT